MSDATRDLEKRLEDAQEYYRTHDVSIREAARVHGLQNHVTLSNRIHGKHSSVSNSGGNNKLLSPTQEAVILAYGQSQAYAGWPCDRRLVSAAVEHIRNQGRDPDDLLPAPRRRG